MTPLTAPEPGTEVFRGLEHDGAPFDLSFGPVGGRDALWSLWPRTGGQVDRVVFFEPRPSRRHLRLWLTEIVGDDTAQALLGRIGGVQHFYAGYYAARPDLAGPHLFGVA